MIIALHRMQVKNALITGTDIIKILPERIPSNLRAENVL